MIDYENPKNWTKQYVTAHHSECLLYLREVNVLAINYIGSHRYYAASIGIESILLNGLDALLKSGRSDGVRSCIATYSCACAELAALADPVAIENEIRDAGSQPNFQGKSANRYLRDAAIAGFEDVLDYAASGNVRDFAASMEQALKAGVSAEQIRKNLCPNFPKDIQNTLLKMDDDFFVPEIMRCAPDRCVVLDKDRLIFTQRLVENESSYANCGPVDMPMDIQDSESDAFMAKFGLDGENLEWVYKRVKLRRNIYGILSIFPPFGVILLPFWLRAVFLTKAIRYRSMDVDFNILTKIVLFIYGIPSLFIYPFIMGHIIKWTNWGMGLRDRRALVPTFVVLALFVFLFIQSNGISLPDISGLANFFSRTPVADAEQTELPTEEMPDDVDDTQSYQDSGFIFPDSGTELILQQEIENLSDSELTYAINEIYARHGYIFRSDELRGYYEQFSWYTGEISADEFSVDCFNQIEQQNWNLLVNERNHRKSSN